ncbi:four helix bundle protein [bacterium]|nr:MAG: four helix bundle protein [bacterium]
MEGDGRRSDIDSIRYFRYSRSSAREARWWLRRAVARGIASPEEVAALIEELTECAKMINGLIRFRQSNTVRESGPVYDDPFAND